MIPQTHSGREPEIIDYMKPFRDPVFQRQLKHAAREKKDGALAKTAEALRQARLAAHAAKTGTPPVDLRRLAKHLGVDEVVFAPLAMQGRVIKNIDKTIIEINEKLDPQLRKFCLAHELSHLILEKDRLQSEPVDGAMAERQTSHWEMEDLCDLCAHEILLPTTWLHGQLVAEGGNLRAALRVSQTAELDLKYVCERIIASDLRPWQAIAWGRVRNRIQAIDSRPKWDAAFLVNIDIINENASPVAKCLAGTKYAEGPIKMVIAGEVQEYWMECARQQLNDVFSVIYPRKYHGS